MASISPVGNKWPYSTVNTYTEHTHRVTLKHTGREGLCNGCLAGGQNAWICPSCQVKQLLDTSFKLRTVLSCQLETPIPFFSKFHVHRLLLNCPLSEGTNVLPHLTHLRPGCVSFAQLVSCVHKSVRAILSNVASLAVQASGNSQAKDLKKSTVKKQTTMILLNRAPAQTSSKSSSFRTEHCDNQ